MSAYTLNGNPWGGSFILEASTDGSIWEAMVAKSGTSFLGREGLATGGGGINSGYNSETFSNTVFSIHKPSTTFIPPTGLTNLVGTITARQVSNFSVTLTGYSNYNTLYDFTAHISPGVMQTLGTFMCNCTIKSYTGGVLNIDTTVTNVTSTQTFTLLVRSDNGTGKLEKTLTTNVTVNAPLTPYTSTPYVNLDVSVFSSLTMTSTNVTQINDNSGNGNHFGYKLSGSLNNVYSSSDSTGYPSIRFPTGSSLRNSNAFNLASTSTQSLTLFLVYNLISSGTVLQLYINQADASWGGSGLKLVDGSTLWIDNGAAGTVFGNISMTASLPRKQILCIKKDVSAGNNKVWVNSTLMTTDTSYPGWRTDISNKYWGLGGAASGWLDNANYSLYEFALFSSALSDTDINTTIVELKSKWGI